MPHQELTSKSDFDSALATKDKYVLIYAYEGEINAAAEEAAEKHASNTAAFKVDVAKYPTAKDFFKITKVPTVVIYKDGAEKTKFEGVTAETATQIAAFLA